MLAHDIAHVLPQLRAEAEARMTSRAAVMRKTGGTTTDPDGYQVPEWATVHPDLPFRLAGADRGGSGTRTVDVGGVELQLSVRVGHFPAATTNLRDGDLIEVLSGENATTAWRIVEADSHDQATARRVPLVSIERPEEWL